MYARHARLGTKVVQENKEMTAFGKVFKSIA